MITATVETSWENVASLLVLSHLTLSSLYIYKIDSNKIDCPNYWSLSPYSKLF